MLLMSYAYYYLYYEKSPNDKPKGAQHTPGRGVVGTLRLVDSLKPYAPDSVGWMHHHVAAEKGGERWRSSKMRYTAHKKKIIGEAMNINQNSLHQQLRKF